MDRNRLHNIKNQFQGPYKKVLCVCSAGLLRSPTAAVVLSQEPFNFNTRAAGIGDYALVKVDDVLLEWADEIVCMDMDQVEQLVKMTDKVITCLEIPDKYDYRQPELVALIKERYLESEGQ